MFLDKAILITTSTDERFLQKKIAHIERSMGLPSGFVEVFKNDPDLEDGKRGCYNAHLDVYKYISEKKINHCLVLEDDVHFLNIIKESQYADFLSARSWDVFYIGHKPDFRQNTWMKKIGHRHILQVKTNDRHAYIMNLLFAKKMATFEWNGTFGDRLLRNTASQAFAFFPMKAIQSGPLFTASFYNGITEKFSEYHRVIFYKPTNILERIGYSIKFIFDMPYVCIRSVILAIKK